MISSASTDHAALTRRSQLKADRRQQILTAAASLIADRGFNGVRLEDIGSAAGISGPAIYRHFANKDALLTELLTGVSDKLLNGATLVVESTSVPSAAVEQLIDFHLDFALNQSDLIRVQDRDLHSLPEQARREVRKMQRHYVELWVKALMRRNASLDETSARTQAHAVFGLINSTPHSRGESPARTRELLRSMAMSALDL
ncbi:TetR/AcrR family transcriptional regulator [Hoyosella rhizosphaerae]|uniref:Transcriptional regulator, TetR family protein n=1 Tax=Hoyosella rhizosphaerae TaxID=1755582 RepID=A0A916U9X5_9ACTN|nr:TetR/AcrR family transcriptional regulator [Hoyosella rhizosphaerae]MBN4927571.1 TetR/AcrR family transcriptional regulator [Hoyosella rhizosphaerae]GGC63420.1 putative transcriptional regulator, TetR family protein [Hoyosella rhizosphaerae]